VTESSREPRGGLCWVTPVQRNTYAPATFTWLAETDTRTLSFAHTLPHLSRLHGGSHACNGRCAVAMQGVAQEGKRGRLRRPGRAPDAPGAAGPADKQCTAMVRDRATGVLRRCRRPAAKDNPQQRCAAHAAQCASMYREYKDYCMGRHADNDIPAAPCRPLHARQNTDEYVRSVQQQMSANRGCEARIRAFDTMCMTSHADFDLRAKGSRGSGHEDRLRGLQRETEECEGLLANARLQKQRHEERLAARRMRGLVAAAARERGEDVSLALTPLGSPPPPGAATPSWRAPRRRHTRAAAAAAADTGVTGDEDDDAAAAGDPASAAEAHVDYTATAAATEGAGGGGGGGGGGVTPQRLRGRGIVAVMYRPRPESEMRGQRYLNRTPERRPSLAELLGQLRVPSHRYRRTAASPVRMSSEHRDLFLQQ